MSNIKNAEFIRQAEDIGTVCPVFHKVFWTEKKVTKALLSVSALGFYEAYINGKRVGSFIFAPGWTSYETRLQYQVYNVTSFIEECNEIDIALGIGRRFHKRKNEDREYLASGEAALIAALEITYDDGSVENIYTDGTWEGFKSNILYSDIYNGETVDFNADTEEKIEIKTVPADKDILIPTEGEETREMARIEEPGLIVTPKGEFVLDFRQNLTGYVEWLVPGKKGAKYTLLHGEVLDKDGNFYNANLRSAKAEVTAISDGIERKYKPHFSFQGFRFVKLLGFEKDEIKPENFTAVVVFSNMKRTGFFACGSDLVQQLYENIIWGQRGNFLDVPTDCPQRDERMGWTGDAQVFARTASINYDTDKFFTKWLHDLKADQKENGAVPHVIPAGWDGAGSAAWGDAAVIVPYWLYVTYGNTAIIRDQFSSMKAWIKFIESQCSEKGLWDKGEHFGDWLSLDAGDEACGGLTDKSLIATAMLSYSSSLIAKMGKVIGEDVSYYEELHDAAKKQYQKYFLNTGDPRHETQTARVLSIYFDLADDKKAEGDKLIKDIEECGHLKTGFVGTPYLLHALTSLGRTDLAYKLLLREDFPSWLYPVKHGATTMWERWDALKPNGSFTTTDMTSFNHYAYGSVGDWIYAYCAGIRADENEPGYKHIIFEPHPTKALGYAKARILTRCGEVISSWCYTGEGDECRFSFTVPNKSRATLYLDGEEYEFLPGTYDTQFSIKGE